MDKKELLEMYIKEKGIEHYLIVGYIVNKNRFKLHTMKFDKDADNLGTFIKAFIKKNNVSFDVVLDYYNQLMYYEYSIDSMLEMIREFAYTGLGMATLLFYQTGNVKE